MKGLLNKCETLNSDLQYPHKYKVGMVVYVIPVPDSKDGVRLAQSVSSQFVKRPFLNNYNGEKLRET